MNDHTTPVPYTPTPWVFSTGCIYADDGQEYPESRLIFADRHNYETTPAERDANLKLSVHAANSYAKHCGPLAIQCAEDDLLGQALDALRDVLPWLDDLSSDGCGGVGKLSGEIRDLLSRLPH